MRCIVWHSAIVSWDQDPSIFLPILLCPELEATAEVEEVLVMDLVSVWEDTEITGTWCVGADESECIV